MIKYVFWDFNGTILDDRELCYDLLNELLISEDKKPVPYERYFEVFGFPVKEYYKKAGITFKYQTYEQMADWFILKYQPLSLKQSLYEGVEETLKSFKDKGIKNICLSASFTKNLKEQLKHFKIDHYFDTILGTSDVLASGKIDVAKKFILDNNIKHNEVLLIGDTLHDYEIAKELGFLPVLFTLGHQSKKRLSLTNSMLINNIKELIEIVEKENKNEEVF